MSGVHESNSGPSSGPPPKMSLYQRIQASVALVRAQEEREEWERLEGVTRTPAAIEAEEETHAEEVDVEETDEDQGGTSSGFRHPSEDAGVEETDRRQGGTSSGIQYPSPGGVFSWRYVENPAVLDR